MDQDNFPPPELVYIVEEVNIAETLYPDLVHELVNVFPINQTTSHVTDDNSDDEETPETWETEESGNEVAEDDIEIAPLWAEENLYVVGGAADNVYPQQGCCKNDCIKQFSADDLRSFRLQCAEIDNCTNGINRLDTILLFKLQSLVYDDDKISHARRSTSSPRQRLRVNYCMKGLPVCRKTFLFCHGISHMRLERLLHVFKNEGPGEKLRHCKKPVPSTSLDSAQHVITFLRNYAVTNALFIPGRLAQKYAILKLLPAGLTKKAVYEQYLGACAVDSSQVAVSLLKFRQLWRIFCADIVILRPRSELCSFCFSLFSPRSEYAGKNDSEKIAFLRKAEEHLNVVKKEHEAYFSSISVSRERLQEKIDSGFSIPADSRILNVYQHSVHLSFNFVQQIHLPNLPQQPGPVNFCVPYKVAVFGIMNNTFKVQHNFVIPEAVLVSKGSNSIISYLHHYLENYLPGVDILELQADNCVVRNKNNLILAYFQWRILAKKNHRISYRFLPAGHTKFECDVGFSLFKKSWRHSEAHTIDDALRVFDKSSPDSKLNRTIKCGTEQGDVLVPTYDWKNYFCHQYKLSSVRQIAKYTHFTFNKEYGAAVKVQENRDDSGAVFRLFSKELANNVTFHSLQHLTEILPLGLTSTRKKYLYDNVRQFVREDAKDVLCPKPLENILTEAAAAVVSPDLQSAPKPRKKASRPKKKDIRQNGDNSNIPPKKSRPQEYPFYKFNFPVSHIK